MRARIADGPFDFFDLSFEGTMETRTTCVLTDLAYDSLVAAMEDAIADQSRIRRERCTRNGRNTPRWLPDEIVTELDFPHQIEFLLVDCEGIPTRLTVDLDDGRLTLDATLQSVAPAEGEGAAFRCTYDVE